ncbi:unnamed protein product [marine sediment metagenome]|uniref:Uncharacterized protein n=1 Tax=marine sediment metagenome TaxID=412755 RepID=X1TKW8_9ZZZZ
MDGKVTPKRMPSPVTPLGYDGTDFHALKVDSKRRLSVRGEDQLLSFKEPLLSMRNYTISGADGLCNSHTPPAGEVWVVTSVSAIDMTSPTTEVIMTIARGASVHYFHTEEIAKGAGKAWTVQCEKHLVMNDFVQVYFIGGLEGDQCWVTVTGHIMTLES